jgi:hypothetical protein
MLLMFLLGSLLLIFSGNRVVWLLSLSVQYLELLSKLPANAA